VHHSCNKEKQLWCIMNMQLQKEVISIQKQQAGKKVCSPKISGWKKNTSMAKILITTIQVNLVPSPSETWRRTHKFT